MTPNRQRAMRWTVFLFPAAFLLCCLPLKDSPKPTYFLMIQEDHILENLQAVLYLLASIGAFIAANRFRTAGLRLQAVLFFILAFGLFFTAGEEIRWGQRVFNYHVPEFFKTHNIQGETTLHNLGIIQSRMVIIGLLVGSYGSFAWLATNAFHGKIRTMVKWFAPDWFLSSYFFPTLLLHVYFMLHDYSAGHGISAFPIGGLIVYRDQEVTEFLQASGFLWFVVFAWRRQEKNALVLEKPLRSLQGERT